MRVLVTGAAGQLGRSIARAFDAEHEVLAVSRAELDIADARAVRDRVERFRPALIVNCAVYNEVDRAEDEPALALSINGVAPRALADAARLVDALLVARDASAVDYWFSIALAPRLSPRFPYSLHLVPSLRENVTIDPRTVPLRSAPPSARRVMKYIISRFHENAQRYGFIPVVAAIPGDAMDFRDGIRGLDDLFSGAPEGVVFVDATRGVARIASGEYGTMFGHTHYSARANEEIARAIASELRPHMESAKNRLLSARVR